MASKRFIFLSLVAVQFWALLKADYVLGPTEVNDSLKKIALLRTALQGELSAQKKADSLYQLGREAEDLTFLINLEIRSHGFEQRKLIELAIERCDRLGITIAYDAKKRRYLYDRQAFETYLELDSNGNQTDEAWFLIIEKNFYSQDGKNRDDVEALLDETEQFLRRYPEFRKKSEAELYLAINYRDLFRLKEASQPDAASPEKQKAIELCRQIVENYPAKPEARVAQGILKSLIPDG